MSFFAKKSVKRSISLLLLLVLFFSFSPISYADPPDDDTPPTSSEATTGGPKDEDGKSQKEADMSFYKIASAAATFYEEVHNEKSSNFQKGKGYEALSGISMNTASSLMGFKDEDYDSWIIGSTISKLSASAQGRGYIAKENGVRAYLLYGNALNLLGLDTSANANFNAISSIGRLIFGGLFGLFYMIANAADAIMEGCLQILFKLNPFSLFTGPGGITSSTGAINGVERPILGLHGLQVVLSKFYKDAQDFAWLILPFSLVWLIWGFLMRGKKSNSGDSNWTRLRKYITRVFFIVLGVPVLASALAMSMSFFLDIKNGEGFNPDGIVAMTFMDFETWARQSRLGLPPGVKVEVNTSLTTSGKITGATTDPMEIAGKLNTHISNTRVDNSALLSPYGHRSLESSWTAKRVASASNAANLIGRFMAGSFYDSAAYESDMKSLKPISKADIELLGVRSKWHGGNVSFAEGDQVVNDGRSSYLHYSNVGELWTFTGSSPNFGNLNTAPDEDLPGAGGFTPSPSSIVLSGVPGVIGMPMPGMGRFSGVMANIAMPDWFNNRTAIGSIGGLSTLGMYNYLNTTFTPSSVVVYSSNKLSSIIVRDAHRSVSLVGEGLMGTLNYLNGLTLMIFVAVIAIGYGLGMLIANLRRTIRLIGAVPLSVMGSLRMMARLVTIAFMMIMEIFVTLLSYILMLQLVYGINKAIRVTFQDLFNYLGFQAVIGMPHVSAVSAPVFLGALVAIIVNLWFLIMGLRVRKLMVKAVDEWMGSIVDRFFMTQGVGSGTVASDPSNRQKQPGLARQAAGAIASGAGMAAGMNMYNKMANTVNAAVGGVSGISGDDADKTEGEEQEGTAKDKGSKMEGAERQAHGSSDARRVSPSEDMNNRGELMLASGMQSLGDNSPEKDLSPDAKQGLADRSPDRELSSDAKRKDVDVKGVRATSAKDRAANQAKAASYQKDYGTAKSSSSSADRKEVRGNESVDAAHASSTTSKETQSSSAVQEDQKAQEVRGVSATTEQAKATSSSSKSAVSSTSGAKSERKVRKVSASTDSPKMSSSSAKKNTTSGTTASTPRKDVKASSSSAAVSGVKENDTTSSVENEVVKGVSVVEGNGSVEKTNVSSSGRSRSSAGIAKEKKNVVKASPRKEAKAGGVASVASGKGATVSSTTAQKAKDISVKGVTSASAASATTQKVKDAPMKGVSTSSGTSTTTQKTMDAPRRGATIATSSVEKTAKTSSATQTVRSASAERVRGKEENVVVRQTTSQEGVSRVEEGRGVVSSAPSEEQGTRVVSVGTTSRSKTVASGGAVNGVSRRKQVISTPRASRNVATSTATSKVRAGSSPLETVVSRNGVSQVISNTPGSVASSNAAPSSARRTVFIPSGGGVIRTKGTIPSPASSMASNRVQVPQSMASRIGVTPSLRTSPVRSSGKGAERKGSVIQNTSRSSVISSVGIGNEVQEARSTMSKSSFAPSRGVSERYTVRKAPSKQTVSSRSKQTSKQVPVQKGERHVEVNVKETAPKVVEKERVKSSSGPIPTFSKDQIGMASVMTTMNRMSQARKERKAYKAARRAEKEEGFMNLFGPSKGHYVDKRNTREEDS